jgi:hypothetical protein
MPKLINVKCHEPVALPNREDIRQGWSDVWLEFTVKPGRKKERICVCLVSRGRLIKDIDFEKSFIVNYPKYFNESKVLLDDYELILNNLDLAGGGSVFVDEYVYDTSITIYINNEVLSRNTIESVLDSYLCEKFGFESCKFKWERPRFITTPV